MTSGVTERDRAKADRQASILHEAARLFADRGYAGVTLEELGQAAGVSGPAVYRHFPGKSAVLAAILLDASRGLLDGGRRTIAQALDPADALRALIRFHVDFALANADVIRVQDRDLASLDEADAHEVRRLQREYVEAWIGILSAVHPGRSEAELRVRAHACFGLINSTPHSVRALRAQPDDGAVRGILESMALAALTA